MPSAPSMRSGGGLSDVERRGRQADDAMLSFQSTVRTMVTVEAVRRVAQFAQEVGVLADQAQITERTFARLAGRSNKLAEFELDSLRQATQGTISDLELMQRVGAAVDAGLTFNQARTALEFLRGYSLAFGKDFNQLVQTIFTGLQRGSVLFLDDAGIILSAQDEMFKGMGELEKKSALVNTAVEMMADKMKDLQVPTEGAAIAVERQAAAWANLKAEMGNITGDLVEASAQATTGVLEDLTRMLQTTQELTGGYPEHGPKLPYPEHGPALPVTPAPPRPSSPAPEERGGLDLAFESSLKEHFAFVKEMERDLGLARSETAEMSRFVADVERDQRAEKKRLADEERAADKEARRQQTLLNQQRQLEHQRIVQVNSVLARLTPQMSSFFNVAAEAQQGDIFGAVIQGVHGILDVLGVAKDENDRYAQHMRRVAEATLLANQSAQTILETLPATSDAMKLLQQDAIEPLRRAFELQREAFPDRDQVSQLRAFFDEIAALDVAAFNLLKEGSIVDVALDEAGLDFGRLKGAIQVAFGKDSSLVEAARHLFEVGEAATSARDRLAPFVRDIRSEFDVREMAFRRQAQTMTSQAGGDVHAQRQVFMQLKQFSEARARLESSRMRGLSPSGVPGAGSPAPRAGTPPPSAAPPTIDPALGEAMQVAHYNQLLQLPGPDGRIEVHWPDAVFINHKYGTGGMRPQSWDDMLVVPGADARIDRDWWEAVHLNRKYGTDGHRPHSWTDILVVPGTNMRIDRDWWEAVFINRKYGTGGMRPQSWADVLVVPGEDSRIGVHWREVIDIDFTPIVIDPVDLILFSSNKPRISWRSLVDMGGIEDFIADTAREAVRDRHVPSPVQRRRGQNDYADSQRGGTSSGLDAYAASQRGGLTRSS